jgi:SAM-dependent methyltransferase
VNHDEYLALQKVEREHWFYRGKRDLTRWWIERELGKVGPHDTVLDAGAGTGEFVRELLATNQPPKVIGVEYAAEGRRIAKELNGIELLEGSILALPLESSSVRVAVALDVLEHVENDSLALSELIRVVQPGGLVIVNVPAFQLLWSDWDVVLGHYRRYSMEMFKTLIEGQRTVNVRYLSYVNVFAFPLILMYRAVARILKPKKRAEDQIPGPVLNSLLYSLFVTPAKWSWFKPPFGVSLFCVLKKE